MRQDTLAYEIRLAIERARTVGTRYNVVDSFRDGVVEIDGRVDLNAVAERLLRLQVDHLPHIIKNPE